MQPPSLFFFIYYCFWRALGERNTQLLKHHIRLYPFDAFHFPGSGTLFLLFARCGGRRERERELVNKVCHF